MEEGRPTEDHSFIIRPIFIRSRGYKTVRTTISSDEGTSMIPFPSYSSRCSN